jgi:superfamily II DNA/RNA helicase
MVEGRGRRRIRLLRPIPKPIATSNDDNDDVEDDDEDYGEEATPPAADDERPQYAIPTIDEATNEFSRLGLAADLVRGLAAQGFATPTPVQRAVIPRLLGGENLVMAASTGSGKTLAFALPAIQSLLSQEAAGYERQPRRPRCVILVPTRELAKQILSAIKVRAVIDYR